MTAHQMQQLDQQIGWLRRSSGGAGVGGTLTLHGEDEDIAGTDIAALPAVSIRNVSRMQMVLQDPRAKGFHMHLRAPA